MLGLLGAAQFVPLFLLTPVAGVAADRFDRRRVVLFANVIDCGIALALAFATAQRRAEPAAAVRARRRARLGAGVQRPGAVSAIAPNIVPPALLPKAIALSSIAWQVGTVIGPAVGGFLFAAQPLAALLPRRRRCCSSRALLISSIRPVRAVHEGPPRHPLKQIVDGFRFVRRERFLLGCITLDLFAVLLGGATAMLPVFARDILARRARGPRPDARRARGRRLAGRGLALVEAVRAQRRREDAVGGGRLRRGDDRLRPVAQLRRCRSALLACLGAADMISVFIRNSLVQLNTPDTMRGRVSAISGLAISASNELGELQSGLAAGAARRRRGCCLRRGRCDSRYRDLGRDLS